MKKSIVGELTQEFKKPLWMIEMEQKLSDRAKQISICLKCEPINIVENEGGNPEVVCVANLSKTPMYKAYKGCGKATAYVKGAQVIAYHYGYQQPDNAPECDYTRKVMLSCGQICF